jgi:sugar phosphate isomerase/epimerase
MAEHKGLRLSVEVQPGAVAQGAQGILKFIDAIGYKTGYNLDTGHAWASGHQVEYYPRLLGGAILGSHLCDNDGKVNLSLCPGEGTVNFPVLFEELSRSGYQGWFDIEIGCPADQVEAQYSKGLEYIKKYIAT